MGKSNGASVSSMRTSETRNFTTEGYLDHGEVCARKTIKDRWGRDHVYTLTPIKAGAAFKNIGEISRIVGPAFDALVSAASDSKGSSGAFDDLARLIANDGVDKVLSFMNCTARDNMYINSPLAFDRAYTMNLRELFIALAWTIAEQYGDFFEISLGSTGRKWLRVFDALKDQGPEVILSRLGSENNTTTSGV